MATFLTLATAGFGGDFPDAAKIDLLGNYILRDSLDLQRTVPRDGDINYRVTTPSGVVDLLILEQGNIRDLANTANEASVTLFHAEDLVQLYAVLTCDPDRSAARKIIARSFDSYAKILDLRIEGVGGALPSIKTPAAAAIAVRLRDHLREAASLLTIEGQK